VESRSARFRQLLGLIGALTLAACGLRSRAADLYPELVEQEGKKIDDVRFTGTEPFGRDTLLRVVKTLPSRCNFMGLPVCVPFTRIGRQEHFLNLARIQADVETLERFYRIAGYFGTRVTPTVVPESGEDNVDVTFTIRRGDPVVLDQFTVTGTEAVLAPDSLAERLPLRAGDLFHLGKYLAASDSVLRGLQRRGHAYAEVLRSFTVDTIDNRAEASLDAVPGPRVVIDSIIVQGAENLGRRTTQRQLEFRKGDVLQSEKLLQSQRNLYGLELVSLASVTVAPDSMQVVPEDSSRATVLVSVVEAKVNALEAAVGFGSIECLRSEARWVNRSFTGGARRLVVFGSVSRLGVGQPFSIHGGERVCGAFDQDTTFGSKHFDYRFSADFTQPYFLSARNQLGVNVFVERLSEPGVFQRQAIGGRAGLNRRLGLRSGVGAGLDAERGATVAAPALFCAYFLVCEPATIDSLQGKRFRVELGLNSFYEDTDNRLEPTHGKVFRTALAWAPVWLGSDVTFLRWTGEAALYRRVRARTVAAFALRAGNFFRTASLSPVRDFLPPEERLYAGGATSMRGYERNAMGPGAYVTDEIVVNTDGDTVPKSDNPQFVPTGGTSLVVASAELRMPSPFLRDRLRLVPFVDVGSLGTASVWDLANYDLKYTPGLGFRMTTPVGPLRIDVAYNPHRRAAGPLLLLCPRVEEEADRRPACVGYPDGSVRRVNDNYRPPSGGFFRRMRVHFGIGHAF
jgi:outer membrane protein assembly factor BamA